MGLLGGIGAGKSTAAAMLAELGCAVIDGDAIGHDLLAEPDVRAEIRARWGEVVFDADGSVDRGRLGAVAFSDADELAALNAIMHLRIRRRIEAQIAAARSDPAVAAVVVDAAVMVEAGWHDVCTHLVFIDAEDAQRAARAWSARGWDQTAWQRREELQISLDKKRSMCDDHISNCFRESHLRTQLRELFHEVTHTQGRSWRPKGQADK